MNQGKLLRQLKKLVTDHAYWSGEVARLKRLGSSAYYSCESASSKNESMGMIDFDPKYNCLQLVIENYKSLPQEPYNFIAFNEFYFEALADGEVCEQCQLCRKYKTERSYAATRLGKVRSGITKIGSRLGESNEKKN